MTILLRQKPLPQVVRQIVQRDNGCWLDASDLSTMYQDAAGTIPVTAMEQPVGLWKDKSGSGNHATQSITASRPVVSARNNLLLKTEDFADAAWLKVAGGTGSVPIITSNYGVSPDGAMTAARIQMSKGAGTLTTDFSTLVQTRPSIIGATYTTSLWVKTNNTPDVTLWFDNNGGIVYGKNITVTSEWTQVQIPNSANQTSLGIRITVRGAFNTSNVADILIWHPQYELGPVATRYQRVNTATDYDTDGFPVYLRFDGVDDYMALPYMGLYANGSASVVVGIAAASTSSYDCIVAERSSSADSIPAYQILRTESGTDIDSYIRSSTPVSKNFNGLSGVFPTQLAILAVVDTGAKITHTKNSAMSVSDTYARNETVVVGNTVLMASRYGATVTDYFNGNVYGLLITKSALSDADRRKCEVYLGRKAGVQL